MGRRLAGLKITPMTESHWKLIDFLQKDYAEQGVMPGIRRASAKMRAILMRIGFTP